MFWIAFILFVFPQDKVDKVCLENREKRLVSGVQRPTTQKKRLPFENLGRDIAMSERFFTDQPVFSGSEVGVQYIEPLQNGKADLYIGPGPDTFLIDTNYVQNGNVIIYGRGTLLVDSAKLTLNGHLWIQNQGQAIFRNNAHLSFKQFYAGQYKAFLLDSARFEATDATIDGNGITFSWVELHEYSTYIAQRTHFSDWVFRKCFNHSTLIVEDANMVGDLLVDDSCNVSFLRCNIVLPWLEMSEGVVADFQFPDIDTVWHFEFSDALPGVNGIGYTMTVDTCYNVWWAIESFPGCSLTIRDCTVMGTAIRMPGSDTITLSGITDYTLYPNLLFPLPDRHHSLVNSYVYSWQPYPLEETVFYIDSCTFGEMASKDNSFTYATRCTCDGIWLHLGTQNNAFMSFTDGSVKSFVETDQMGTLLLVNTSVECVSPWAPPPLGPNYAHHHSNLLAVNCYFEYKPEAMDTALVMVTAIDSPDTGMIDTTIEIFGSAWIDAGPYNPITFNKYKLYWTYDGDSVWMLIEESTSEVDSGVLGTWNTSGMTAGDYDLRLTIWDSAGDSLIAFGDITLVGPGVEEADKPQDWKLSAYQQGSELRISFNAPVDRLVTLDIFDIAGRKVRNLFTGRVKEQTNLIYKPSASGGYFIKLSDPQDSATYKFITKKVVFVR